MENFTEKVPKGQEKHFISIYLKLMFIVYEPIVISIGLIGNLLIIVTMPRKSVTIAPTIKFYYLAIAIADFIDIINSWFLWVILSDTLNILTGGQYSIDLVTMNDFTCKVMVLVWAISEIFSDYALTAMTIEMLVALYLPLKSKTILTKKFTILLLSITILPMWAAVLPFVPFVSNIQNNPGSSATGQHCTRDRAHPLYNYYVVAFNVVMNVIHEVVNSILIIFLIVGILKSYRNRRSLTDSKTAHFSSFPNAPIILFLMLLINSIVFLPNFVFQLIYYMIQLKDETILVTIGNLGRFFADMIVIAHSLNFFVYYWRIQTFRLAINNLCISCSKFNRNYTQVHTAPATLLQTISIELAVTHR